MPCAGNGPINAKLLRTGSASVCAPAYAFRLRPKGDLCAAVSHGLRTRFARHSHAILQGLNRGLRRDGNLCAKRLRRATKNARKTRYCRIGYRRFWAPCTQSRATSCRASPGKLITDDCFGKRPIGEDGPYECGCSPLRFWSSTLDPTSLRAATRTKADVS